ncbi:unnamed protein product [Fusarium equiseti]|uniref:Uncharacterized protein n=1 Tax=Fusarium equiseti TaxID=61235 RepID=A0A8J2NFK1_FUSEQ|nr:unnamed protein product [Fusarium equiseti]
MAHYSQIRNKGDHYPQANSGTPVYYPVPSPYHPPGPSYPNDRKHDLTPTTIELGTFEAHHNHKNDYIPTYPLQPAPRYERWWSRIGCFGLWVLGLGTIVILAACWLLVYIWIGSMLARDRRLHGEMWDMIVVGDYVTRVVTLCSAAIRVSIAFQTGLLAAAMAAFILETTGSRLSNLAGFSIARAANATPWEIYWMASQQKLKRKGTKFLQCSIPLLAFLVNLITTFASTILLSDFATTSVAVLNTTTPINVGFDMTKDTADFSGISYWQSKPLAHWRFAETRPTISNLTVPKGVADTGDIYRALLPLENVDNRTSLEFLSGSTVVTNLRTICVAPNLSNSSLVYKTGDTSTTEGLYLEALLESSSTGWEGGPKVNGNTSFTFSCRINNEWNQTGSAAWPLSMCTFTELMGPNVSYDETLQNPLSGQPYAFQPVILLNASEVLNNITSQWNETAQHWSPAVIPKWIQPSKIVQNGTWSTALGDNGTEVFQTSVCFITHNMPLLYNVTMSGKAVPAEPKSQARWKRLHAKTGTEFINQLGVGVSPKEYERRGILDLKIRSGPRFFGVQKPGHNATLFDFIGAALFEYSNAGGWAFNNDAFTGFVDSSLGWLAHPEHSLLLQKVLQETGNPAEALQNLFFRFYQMIFYDMLPYYTAEQLFELANAKQVFIPIRWTGLVIILSVLVVHLALMLVVVWLFAISTGISTLGNAWQAVTQIVSSETTPVLQAVSNNSMSDCDVKEWAKSTAYDERSYGLSGAVSNGESGMWRR